MNDIARRAPTAVICMTATGTAIIMTRELKQIICDRNRSRGTGEGGVQQWKQWEVCLSPYTFSTNICQQFVDPILYIITVMYVL